ncbi:venom protease-like [Ruditapes philippinarum]|uniref:venom protease-like n=1 Tax=Ruditapes philippinarum TaxID=129788 RepID=UPI00295A97D9|nr:venom protease-like [Ruditapes philippinarum]
MNVFLSDYDILEEDTNEIWPVVHDVMIHDKYTGEEIENLGIHANDVALLDFGQKESERPVLNKYLRPICVATAKDSLKAAKTYFRISQSFSSHINTFTAGWGNAPDNIHHTSLLHSKMMQNQRHVVKQKYCKRRYENIDLHRFFCVGEDFEESDSCMGDIGGPFMVQMHDKRFFSLGLALKTRDCKVKNNYSIFLNLLHPTVSEWINRVLDGCNKFGSKDD